MSIADCIRKNDFNGILRLVKNGLSNNFKGNSILIYASARGRYEIVKYLVQHNAEINEKDSTGCTALIWALINKHFKIVKYLIKHGAFIYIKISDKFALKYIKKRSYLKKSLKKIIYKRIHI